MGPPRTEPVVDDCGREVRRYHSARNCSCFSDHHTLNYTQVHYGSLAFNAVFKGERSLHARYALHFFRVTDKEALDEAAKETAAGTMPSWPLDAEEEEEEEEEA